MHAEARAIEVAGVAAGERSKMERGSHCQNFKCFWRWWRYHFLGKKRYRNEKAMLNLLPLMFRKYPNKWSEKNTGLTFQINVMLCSKSHLLFFFIQPSQAPGPPTQTLSTRVVQNSSSVSIQQRGFELNWPHPTESWIKFELNGRTEL